ncbi:Eukaryotic translation initiation factor isoform 4G-2 [Acorus gramineus]|uniref:Eukaryotic translation initiation factor isoform 4G-2 n=1 Tax=Acorus gramineus TaxID=55184 RepID=A0AAV9AWC4_ACOGR|nr:Eukaryotic translation initiation factor isoform 4G-2 [Acorus gramineus]
MTSCFKQVLLEQDGNTCFLKENVEAVCQLFNSIDERVYDSPLARKHMDPHINHLTSLAVDPELGPQLRPMVRDVLCGLSEFTTIKSISALFYFFGQLGPIQLHHLKQGNAALPQ